MRFAFTLMELVVSLAASSVLAVGLVSALYVSTGALSATGTAAQLDHTARQVLQRLATDVRLATSISERTARTITVNVPDRDGDNASETIRYAWSGVAGDPLVYTYNALTVNLAEEVQSFDLSAITRTMLADSGSVETPPGVVYEGYSPKPLSTNGTSLTIDTPADCAEGDLLIACVATDGDNDTNFMAPSGWNTVYVAGNTSSTTAVVTLGVWWKPASASEPSSHTFSWSASEQAYGWIMRFTGHDADNPIHSTSLLPGNIASTSIDSPAVSTSVENCLILRTTGIDRNYVTAGSSGVADHTTITMDSSGTMALNAASGGAAYKTFAGTGDTGASSFAVSSSSKYVSVTIAIAPEVP